MRKRFRWAGMVLWSGLAAWGQSPGQSSPPDAAASAPVYTLGAAARLVIEDVLVTDKAGAPVKGLPANAFHLTDDDVPQKVLHFEEATGESGPATPAAKGTFSNAAMVNPSGPVVVLLIDPASMDIPDQMFLRLQMLRYLHSMPEGVQTAVFKTYGTARPLLVQSLTTDHALLERAIDGSIPTISLPQSTRFSNALAEVANISAYLAQVPGRKELVWFSGRFPLFVSPLNHSPDIGYTQLEDSVKFAFRLLERARVEVFPIDCRGVIMGGPALNQAGSEAAMKVDPSIHGMSTTGEGSQDAAAYDAMDGMAAATGGRAFYSTNGLAQAIGKAIDLARDSYTLTYRPAPYKADGVWRRVKLTVDGPYRVSFRQGYYADERAGAPRQDRLSADGDEALAKVESAQQVPPIRFDAHLSPQGVASRGGIKLQVDYGIAAKDLQFVPIGDGRQQAQIKVAALAYGWDGGVVSSAVDTLQTHFDARQMGIAGRVGVPFVQEIEVDKRAKYLLLAVFDLKTGRTGTVQVAVGTVKSGGQ